MGQIHYFLDFVKKTSKNRESMLKPGLMNSFAIVVIVSNSYLIAKTKYLGFSISKP